MIRFTFKKGLRFLQGTRAFTLLERLVNHKLRLEDEVGKRQDLILAELNRRWISGEWVIDEQSLGASNNVFYVATPRDLQSVPEKQKEQAKLHMSYLTAIEKSFRKAGGSFVSTTSILRDCIATASVALKDPSPPSPQTVWRWWKRFNPTRCVHKLIDGRERSGRRRNEVLLGVFEEAIAEVFLNKQKHPAKAVFERMEEKVRRTNEKLSESERLPAPNKPTVYRWLKQLHYGLVKKAREGKAATERELRAALDTVKVEYILERIEIDHTPLDLLVIDKVTRLILGRPWITLAIDRKSRCILGFYISFHAPSAHSVLHCLKQVMLPKDLILARFPDVKSPWPCRGIPDLVVCDNGMELHANAVETVCFEMGIELLYCGVAHPEMKGAIERLFRTLAEDLIHRLPGTVFSNPDKRGDYPSEEEAAIDLETLVHLLVKWIVDKYHLTPHRGLGGRTPLRGWIEGEELRLIEMPAYPQQLDTICGAATTRCLFLYGLEVDYLFYNSPLLQVILHRSEETQTLQVRFFDDDVSWISVLDPVSEEFFRVPAVDQAYTQGLIRDVHRLVVAEARARFGEGWRNEALLDVREEIEAIVDRALAAKKMATRKRAATVLQHDSEAVFAGSACLEAAQNPVDSTPPPMDPLPAGLDDDLPELGISVRPQLEEVA